MALGRKTCASQSIAIGIYPCGVVRVVRMGRKVGDLALLTKRVLPADGLFRSGRLVVGYGVVVERTLGLCLGAGKLIPDLIRLTITILILHHPNNTRLGAPLKGISGYGKVIASAICDLVVEPNNDISTEAAQRYKLTFFEPLASIFAGTICA